MAELAAVTSDSRGPQAKSVVATPPIKSLGGKRKLVPSLVQHLPAEINRYVEPFAGGAALFFALYASGHLDNASVTLSDTNTELISMYLAIRDQPDQLIAHLHEHEDRYRKQRGDYYYAVRSQDPRSWTDRPRVGARYIFLNKTCFNGVSRYNKNGLFNVPHGAFKSEPVICDTANLMACSRALANVELLCEDFKIALQRELRKRVPGHVIYADSPYIPLSKTSNFVSYGREGFSDAEQVALAEHLRQLAKAGVHVVASNSACDRVRELYGESFTIHEVDAKRSINSKGDRRGEIKELIMVSA